MCCVDFSSAAPTSTMTNDEDFKRRLHAYVAVFGLPVSIILLAFFTYASNIASDFNGTFGNIVNTFTLLPIILCLVPFASLGLLWRRYFTRGQSLAAGLLSILFFPVGWLWTPFFLRDWYRVSKLERMGLRQALVFQFAFPFCSTEQISRRLRTLDNEGLVLAFHLPDHTPLAKSMLDREIRVRGLADQLQPDWLPSASRSTVPPNVFRVVSAQSYHFIGLRKESFFRVIRALTIAAVVALPFLFLLEYIVTSASQRGFWYGLMPGSELQLIMKWTTGAFFAPSILMLGVLISFYFSYLAIAFTIGAFYFRNHSGRILLLRPFGHKQMTLSLKKVIWWYLAPFGHVTTLSDRNYKPNLFLDGLFKVFAYLRFIVGPIVRPSYRLASVKTEHSYFMLANSLTKKYRLSTLSLSCGAQAFNVRTIDDWWKACVNLLLNSSDIVVMDVSRVSTGSAWEIERLQSTGFLKNCIFIVQENYQREGQECLQRLLPGGTQPRLYAYRETGEMLDVNGFEATLQECFSRSLATWGKSWTARPGQSISTMVPGSAGRAATRDPAPMRQSFVDQPSPGRQRDMLQLVPQQGGAAISIATERLSSPKGVTLGRASGVDVIVKDNSISKRHARLSLTADGRLRVEDLGSSNGTWKGKSRISIETFASGDLIRIGDVDFNVSIAASAKAPSTPPSGGIINQMQEDFGIIASGEIFQLARTPGTPSASPNAGRAFASTTERGWILSGFDEAGKALQYQLRPAHNTPETIWTVGRRSGEADLVISHSTISTRHARLRYSAERGIELCDLGSGNGTKVDGKSVGRDYVPVTNARKIEFGDAKVALSRA